LQYAIGAYLGVLGRLALLWFVVGLSAALRRPGTRPALLPTVALASGTAIVGGILLAGGQAAVIRVGEGLDPQVARFAFDLGSVTFANAWAALGSRSVASGWAMLTGRAQPA
jgi:hypothetical protein